MSFVVDKCYAYLHGVSNLYTVGMFIVTCKLWIVRLVDNRVGLATWSWEEETKMSPLVLVGRKREISLFL